MGCAESKKAAGGGAGPKQASNTRSEDGWVEQIEWVDTKGEKQVLTAQTLQGWRWGMQLTGIPHPKEWSSSLWQVLERLIVSNGLLALDDEVVCTPEVNDCLKAAGVADMVDLDSIPEGDNPGFLDALHTSLARLVAMERVLLDTARNDEGESASSAQPPSEARGMDRSLTIKEARMFALSEHTYMVNVCRAAALAAQNLVVQGKAQEAIDRVLAAIIDTGAVNLSFTNMRYHIAKYFGYVLPTPALTEWICTQYEDCKRVISVGSGTSFLELALQVAANTRFGAKAFEVVCVENNVELLGLGEEEVHSGQSLIEQKPRGFRVDPTSVQTKLPKFQAGDGVLICWGRSPEIYEQKGNVWTDAEAMAVKTPGVDTCVTIGACDWQYFRPDRWAGHVLQTLGMPPFDPIHDRAGESGLPYGWWWPITGAVEMPSKADEHKVPAATWHGVFGNCMTLYKNVSNKVVSWKRLAAPTHYAPTSAEVVQPSMSGGSAVVGTGTTTSGALTATATTMEADTPFFVEYPEMGTKCRVMAQSEAGLTLGNLFTIIDCNPTLKSALGVVEPHDGLSQQGESGRCMGALRLSLTPDGTNQEYLSGSDLGAATEGQLKPRMTLYLVPR